MDSLIPVTKPCVDQTEAALLQEVLASGWITAGPKVAEFERSVADYVGVDHAISTTSCTTALSVALYAMGIGPGDEVVVPSFSFIATANAVLHVGATPRFADIDLETYNITATTIEAVLTPRTKVIMPVHQVGLPVDLKPIHELAERHGLIVLEDAACALGSEYRGRRVGGHSSCAAFSFHPRKLVTTGEGGMITTNDEDLAGRLRKLCNHGASVTEMERHAKKRPVEVDYSVVGFNYRLSDLQGAVGMVQMRKLDWILQRRRQLAKTYDDAFMPISEIARPAEPVYARTNFQSYMMRLQDASAARRWDFLNALREHGVCATPGVTAIHRQACYRHELGDISLPNTELAADTTVILPLFPDLTESQQRRVIGVVKGAVMLKKSAPRIQFNEPVKQPAS